MTILAGRNLRFALWAALVLATLGSLVLGFDVPSRDVSFALIMAVAFIKAGAVMWEFMEVRGSAAALRLFLGAWLLGSFVLIVVMKAALV